MAETKSTPYDQLGGEAGVRALVEHFYRIMDTAPEAARIRRMHPEDLSGAKENLFLFLSGWLGGPPLYVQKVGHPRLRQRHMPFPIGEIERDQWMLCMERALDALEVDGGLKERLLEAFFRTADFMRNRAAVAGCPVQIVGQ